MWEDKPTNVWIEGRGETVFVVVHYTFSNIRQRLYGICLITHSIRMGSTAMKARTGSTYY